MDPQLDSTDTAQAVYANVFDYLVERDDSLKLVTALAESWKNVDGPDLGVQASRTGSRFQGGSPITAEDVKFTFDRVLEPVPGHQVAAYFDDQFRRPRRGC